MKNIEKSIKLYPLFYAFTMDMIFYVPIDTIFLTLIKRLDASQISAMTMISLFLCIISQKAIIKIAEKIGNIKCIRLGCFTLLLSSIILTFSNSFFMLVIYRTLFEAAIMLMNMTNIVLKNDLSYLNKENLYNKIRNKTNIIYSILTMLTAVISSFLFNINNYIPLYISIFIYLIMFLFSFEMIEVNSEVNIPNINNISSKGVINNSIILYIVLSNALFASIIRIGQINSKLFIQYDMQKFFSLDLLTMYISIVVLISRISRIIGNIFFGKLYSKVKENLSSILTILEFLAFVLLILGHLVKTSYILKFILMSLGFCLILGIRDSFKVYIEDTALQIVPKENQQRIMIFIESSRKIAQLALCIIVTLILLKFELIVVELLLLYLSGVEIIINLKMLKNLRLFNTKN